MNEPTEFLRSGHPWRDFATRCLPAAAPLDSPIAWSADSDNDGIPDDVAAIEDHNPSVKDNGVFTSGGLSLVNAAGAGQPGALQACTFH